MVGGSAGALAPLDIGDSDAIGSTPMRNLSIYDPSRADGFIKFISSLLRHSFVLADSFATSAHGTMRQLEVLVQEHVQAPATSKLKKLVPTVGKMHTSLECLEAFQSYDAKYHLTDRTHVPPSDCLLYTSPSPRDS